jgi:hypothetical protein
VSGVSANARGAWRKRRRAIPRVVMRGFVIGVPQLPWCRVVPPDRRHRVYTPWERSILKGEGPGGPLEDTMIRKLKSGEYRLYSRKANPKTGKRRNLGTFKSRQAAEKHERAVQYFKRH